MLILGSWFFYDLDQEVLVLFVIQYQITDIVLIAQDGFVVTVAQSAEKVDELLILGVV